MGVLWAVTFMTQCKHFPRIVSLSRRMDSDSQFSYLALFTKSKELSSESPIYAGVSVTYLVDLALPVLPACMVSGKMAKTIKRRS